MLQCENQEAKISRRIRPACVIHQEVEFMLDSNQFTKQQRAKVYDICILPVLSYGMKTTIFTKPNFSRIREVPTTIESKLLDAKLKDRTSLEYVKGVRNMVEHTSKQNLSWAGHIIRKQITGEPKDQNKKKTGGKQWQRLAKNGRKEGKTYVRLWIEKR